MRLFLLSILALVTPATVSAQMIDSPYLMDSGQFTNALMANNLINRVRTAQRAAGVTPPDRDLYKWPTQKGRTGTAPKPAPRPTPPAKPASLGFRAAPGVNVPRALAAQYPASKRPAAQAAFADMLSKFHQLEGQFGQPRNDLATAFAATLAGSHMGYSGRSFPDANFAPLVRQMRGILQTSDAVRTATDAQKQEAYELLAIIGMTLAIAQIEQAKNPNPTEARALKQAGGQFLQAMLQVPPEKVAFNAQGLVIR